MIIIVPSSVNKPSPVAKQQQVQLAVKESRVPIILVPATTSSIITVHNAVDFLQDYKYPNFQQFSIYFSTLAALSARIWTGAMTPTAQTVNAWLAGPTLTTLPCYTTPKMLPVSILVPGRQVPTRTLHSLVSILTTFYVVDVSWRSFQGHSTDPRLLFHPVLHNSNQASLSSDGISEKPVGANILT